MAQPAILIVEDEQKLSRVLQLELEYEYYRTKVADNGLDALRFIRDETWDLVLLDIMLPELSGLEVLRRLRLSDEVTPIRFYRVDKAREPSYRWYGARSGDC